VLDRRPFRVVNWVSEATPFGAAAVAAVVVALGDTSCNRRVDELQRGRKDRIAHRDAERTRRVVRFLVDDAVPARHKPLALLEVGQDLGKAPAGRTAFRSCIEVAGIATHISHVVDAR
jgi:hypothetical protein